MSVPKVFYGNNSKRALRMGSPALLCVPGGCSFSRSVNTLLDATRRFLRRSRHHLLRSRTKVPIGAKRAVILGVRGEFSSRDPIRNFLHTQFRLIQLSVIARGGNRGIVFEVVEDQTIGPLSKRIASRQGI